MKVFGLATLLVILHNVEGDIDANVILEPENLHGLPFYCVNKFDKVGQQNWGNLSFFLHRPDAPVNNTDAFDQHAYLEDITDFNTVLERYTLGQNIILLEEENALGFGCRYCYNPELEEAGLVRESQVFLACVSDSIENRDLINEAIIGEQSVRVLIGEPAVDPFVDFYASWPYQLVFRFGFAAMSAFLVLDICRVMHGLGLDKKQSCYMLRMGALGIDLFRNLTLFLYFVITGYFAVPHTTNLFGMNLALLCIFRFLGLFTSSTAMVSIYWDHVFEKTGKSKVREEHLKLKKIMNWVFLVTPLMLDILIAVNVEKLYTSGFFGIVSTFCIFILGLYAHMFHLREKKIQALLREASRVGDSELMDFKNRSSIMHGWCRYL